MSQPERPSIETYGEAMRRLLEIADAQAALRAEAGELEKRVIALRLRVAPLDPLRPIYFNEPLDPPSKALQS